MRTALVFVAALLLAACAGSGPAPAPGANQGRFVPPATLPPSPVNPGPPPGVVVPPTPTAPPPGADRARAAAERLPGGVRDDVLSLLDVAAGTGDEAQRYGAYLGAWQYVRDEYFARGEPPEYRPVLDAIQAVARTFPQYDAGQFDLKPTSPPTRT
jgi:hypothetical protein